MPISLVIAVSRSPEHSEGEAWQSLSIVLPFLRDCFVANAPRNDS